MILAKKITVDKQFRYVSSDILSVHNEFVALENVVRQWVELSYGKKCSDNLAFQEVTNFETCEKQESMLFAYRCKNAILLYLQEYVKEKVKCWWGENDVVVLEGKPIGIFELESLSIPAPPPTKTKMIAPILITEHKPVDFLSELKTSSRFLNAKHMY